MCKWDGVINLGEEGRERGHEALGRILSVDFLENPGCQIDLHSVTNREGEGLGKATLSLHGGY